ncbi:hypothetical protein NDU88_003688 [Pleurodeles waltl]|uniref:Cystatin domain-containing protein n=1 Tax=Pleurodeles waltl TaxID=8319 RepID=A0AAV7MRV3_PLEWA|nr:hypothetical protein NDU88_003688 [Pleurodeles waltl]
MAASWACFTALVLLGFPGLLLAHPMDDDPETVRAETVQLLGGWNPLDVTSKRAIEMADFAESVYNAHENDECEYHTVKILDASYQVVNGFYFHLKLEMLKKGCGHGYPDGHIYSETLQCDVTISLDHRMEQKKLLNESCSPIST